eukprot:TRINITY_DN29933_c0_g1_i2.p1 TRINITY_DN29933_c0_g1~~TRINITY_DN29933_c0_g1_i2.p1  ORF type:complete len:759 (+),score=73.52 TRINITY_DN29933_c0_g1_i2:371-2647(+)
MAAGCRRPPPFPRRRRSHRRAQPRLGAFCAARCRSWAGGATASYRRRRIGSDGSAGTSMTSWSSPVEALRLASPERHPVMGDAIPSPAAPDAQWICLGVSRGPATGSPSRVRWILLSGLTGRTLVAASVGAAAVAAAVCAMHRRPLMAPPGPGPPPGPPSPVPGTSWEDVPSSATPPRPASVEEAGSQTHGPQDGSAGPGSRGASASPPPADVPAIGESPPLSDDMRTRGESSPRLGRAPSPRPGRPQVRNAECGQDFVESSAVLSPSSAVGGSVSAVSSAVSASDAAAGPSGDPRPAVDVLSLPSQRSPLCTPSYGRPRRDVLAQTDGRTSSKPSEATPTEASPRRSGAVRGAPPRQVKSTGEDSSAPHDPPSATPAAGSVSAPSQPLPTQSCSSPVQPPARQPSASTESRSATLAAARAVLAEFLADDGRAATAADAARHGAPVAPPLPLSPLATAGAGRLSSPRRCATSPSRAALLRGDGQLAGVDVAALPYSLPGAALQLRQRSPPASPRQLRGYGMPAGWPSEERSPYPPSAPDRQRFSDRQVSLHHPALPPPGSPVRPPHSVSRPGRGLYSPKRSRSPPRRFEAADALRCPEDGEGPVVPLLSSDELRRSFDGRSAFRCSDLPDKYGTPHRIRHTPLAPVDTTPRLRSPQRARAVANHPGAEAGTRRAPLVSPRRGLSPRGKPSPRRSARARAPASSPVKGGRKTPAKRKQRRPDGPLRGSPAAGRQRNGPASSSAGRLQSPPRRRRIIVSL